MFDSGLSGTLFPVHFKPQDDELLSSWLTRLSIAHGMHVPSFLFAACDQRSKHYHLLSTDVDKTPHLYLVNLLAERTSTPVDRVLSTTLLGYQGLICEKTILTSKTPWVLLGFSRPVRKMNGVQYCPLCLSETQEPYFRRSWRLAFSVICTRHKVQLLDCCSACGASVNLFRRSRASKGGAPTGSMTRCGSCNSDLRATSCDLTQPDVSQDEIEFQESLYKAIANGWIDNVGAAPIYSHLYFVVLRKLINVLSSRSKGEVLREKISKVSGIEMFSMTCLSRDSRVERMCVQDRRRLLDMTRWLLTDFPERFITFCKENKLGCQVLFLTSAPTPFWYWSVVREHLNRTNYKPSDEEIKSAIALYRQKISERRYAGSTKELEAISSFLLKITRSRRRKLFESLGIPDMRLKMDWRNLNTTQRKQGVVAVSPRYLSDSLWAEIEPLIPRVRKQKSSPDNRIVLNGILYVLLTDCKWREIPAEFGTSRMVYLRFLKWKRMGAFEQIWLRCLHLYD